MGVCFIVECLLVGEEIMNTRLNLHVENILSSHIFSCKKGRVSLGNGDPSAAPCNIYTICADPPLQH